MFDKFKNKELIAHLWERMNSGSDSYSSLHEMTGDLSGCLIKELLRREATDNLTVVVIALNGLKSHFNNTEIIQNTAQTALFNQTAKFQDSVINININKTTDETNENKKEANYNYNTPRESDREREHHAKINKINNITTSNASSSRNNSQSKPDNNKVELKENPALFSFAKKTRDEDV